MTCVNKKSKVFIVVLIFFSFSCSEEIKKPENNAFENVIGELMPLEVSNEYSNPDNPLDYIGVLHNEGLDYVAGYLDDHLPDNPTAEEGALYQAKGTLSFFDEVLADLFSLNTEDFEPALEFMTDESKFYYNFSVSYAIQNDAYEGYFNDVQSGYLINIEDAIYQSNSLSGFFTEMDGIVTDIKNNQVLNSEEKEPLYLSASVARHSFAYWIDGGIEKWEKYNPDFNGDFEPKSLAGADMGGAAGGAVAGAFFGPGAIAGAGAGAVSGTVGKAVYDLWVHYNMDQKITDAWDWVWDNCC